MRRQFDFKAFKTFAAIALWSYFIMVMVPLWIVVVTSFKTNAELYGTPLGLPRNFRFDTYVIALVRVKLLASIIRTLWICALSTVLAIVVAFPAAYAAARIRSTLVAPTQALFLSGYLIPTASILVPIYVLMSQLSLVNNPLSLILVYTAKAIPTSVVVMVPFIAKIHISLEESAKIDGASLPIILTQIVFPLSRSGIVTISILNFVSSWNEYFFPMILSTRMDNAVVQTGLQFLRGERNVDYGVVSAGVVTLLAVVALVYALTQRRLIEGLSAASVK